MKKAWLNTTKPTGFSSKNYFTNLTFEEQNIFEDFVLKYGVDHTKFLHPFDAKLNLESQAQYEIIRQKLMLNLINFKEALLSCNFVQEFVKTTKEFLNIVKAEEKLQNLEKEYEAKNNITEQKFTSQVYDKINKLFGELEDILGEEQLNFSEFYNLLEQGLNSVTLSIVPISVDSVFVGDISNNNFAKSKLLFIMGVAEGQAPQNKLDVGIILDSELNVINTKTKLEPSIKELNAKAKFNFFQLLLTATNKLIMSYSMTDKEGNEQRPALVMAEAQKLFFIIVNNKKVPLPIYALDDYLLAPGKDENKALIYSFYYANNKSAIAKLIRQLKVAKESGQFENYEATNAVYNLLEEVYGKQYLNNLINGFEFDNNIDNLSNAQALFFSNNRTKISQLESYFTCPFKHFIEYGLKLKEKERAELRALDIGTILHSVAELFGAMLKEGKTFESNQLKIVAQNIINDILSQSKYAFLSSSSENKNLIQSLKEEAIRLVEAMHYQNENSNFKINKTEYSFGINENKEVLNLEVSGKKIDFAGVVDRIDYYENYFRIIDYKTGKSDFNFKDLYIGKKIQLFIYASVIRIITGKKLAGVFYFPIKNDFESLDAKQKSNTPYKLEGVYLNDLAVVKAMDKTLSPAYLQSKILNAALKITAESEQLKPNNKMLFEEDFLLVEDYALKLATKAIEEILDGNILPSPYSENEQMGACEYCAFKAICKFSGAFLNSSRKANRAITKDCFKEALTNE